MFILTGMKHCGKTTIGTLLAEELNLPFYDLDREIEKDFSLSRGLSIRDMYKKQGVAYFQSLEVKALHRIMEYGSNDIVLSLGGGTIENTGAISILKGAAGIFIFLEVDEHILFSRILKGGIPPFLSPSNPEASFHVLFEKRVPLYKAAADYTIPLGNENQKAAVEHIKAALRRNNGR